MEPRARPIPSPSESGEKFTPNPATGAERPWPTRCLGDLGGLQPGMLDAHALVHHVIREFGGELKRKRVEVSPQLHARHHHLRREHERVVATIRSLMRTAIELAPAGGRFAIRSCSPHEDAFRMQVVVERATPRSPAAPD